MEKINNKLKLQFLGFALAFLAYLFCAYEILTNIESSSTIKYLAIVLISVYTAFAYMIVENTPDKRLKRVLGIAFLIPQIILFIIFLRKWFEPRTEEVLKHLGWLSTLRTLASLHSFSGISSLIRAFVGKVELEER